MLVMRLEEPMTRVLRQSSPDIHAGDQRWGCFRSWGRKARIKGEAIGLASPERPVRVASSGYLSLPRNGWLKGPVSQATIPCMRLHWQEQGRRC